MEVEEGITILEAAKNAGIEIPTLCYSPLLEPYAACRLCLVEIKRLDSSEIVTSCNVKVSEGMEILTDSQKVKRDRNITLELLLAQAPAAEPLKELAKKYEYEFVSIVVENRNERSSVHNVPEETIAKMVDKFSVKL